MKVFNLQENKKVIIKLVYYLDNNNNITIISVFSSLFLWRIKLLVEKMKRYVSFQAKLSI